MGCTGSKEATPEEQQEICKQMAREMMNTCLGPALANGDKIVVQLPAEFNLMKEASAALKKFAADVKVRSAEAPAGGNAPAALGGIFDIFNQVSDLAHKAAGAGAAAAELALIVGLALALESIVVVLDNTIDGLEKPMSTIGKDLVTAKRAEITKTVSEFIAKSKVEDAFNLCQGPATAISQYIIGQSVEDLIKLLQADIGGYVKGHDTIKMWDAAIGKYNEAVEKVKQAGLADKMNLKGITFDIETHICRQVVLGVCAQMGLEEAKVRESPQGKAVSCPSVFFKVFHKDQLLHSDYKKVTRK